MMMVWTTALTSSQTSETYASYFCFVNSTALRPASNSISLSR
jgi:hypothetical protein